MNTQTILIIGGGAAGVSAAQAARNADSNAVVKILSSEGTFPYFRPSLTQLLYQIENEEKKGFFIKEPSWFSDNSIEFVNNFSVASINYDEKIITSTDKQTISWDKLIIATGSRPVVIPEYFSSNPNVYTVRTIDDTRKINSLISKMKSVVIAGGGLLGLEAAWYLLKAGLEVHVSEYFPRLLPRQLDEDGGSFLQSIIEKSGVLLHLGACIKELSSETPCNVTLDNQLVINAGAVIYSTGVKSVIPEFTGVKPDCDRGIIVNEHMETSLENVFAAGDCAQFMNSIPALWMVALKQGDCAGKSAAGAVTTYEQTVYPAMLKAFDTHVMSVGKIEGEFIEHRDENSLIKIFMDENRNACGAYCIGNPAKATKLIKIVKEKQPVSAEILS